MGKPTEKCGTASTQVGGSKIGLITVGTVWYTILFIELVHTAKPGVRACSALFTVTPLPTNKQILYSVNQEC
jgi:hypothetical protein